MPRLYLSGLDQLAKMATLPAPQALHVKVLRLELGDSITLFDGQGLVAQALISHIDKKTIGIEILSKAQVLRQHTFPIHLVQSLIRNEQMDLIIQKAVELGVTEMTPLITERCQGRLNTEQALKKQQHWQEVVIAACEQSGCNFLPTVHLPISFADYMAEPIPTGAAPLILDTYAKQTLRDMNTAPGAAIVVIGPEGGFTRAEMALAHSKGYLSLRLHEQILRAETAAIAATSIVQFYFSPK